jgi:hypothetical protein
MQQALAARKEALARRRSSAPAAGDTVAEPERPGIGPPKSVALPTPSAPVAVEEDVDPPVASRTSAAGVLQSLGRGFAGIATGLAACLLAWVVLGGALRPETDPPRPEATAAPDVTQHLTGIEWMAERAASPPSSIRVPLTPMFGAVESGDREVAALIAEVAPMPRQDAAPSQIAALPTLPEAVAGMSAPRLLRDLPSPVDAQAFAPVLAQPSAVPPVPTKFEASDPPPGLALRKDPPAVVAPGAQGVAADPSSPALSIVMASLKSRLDPPEAIMLAAFVHPDRAESRFQPGAIAAPHPPRVERESAGWTGPAATTRGPLRVILTQSRDDGADVARLDRLGVAVAEVQHTQFVIPLTRVHYFHPEDAGAAGDLATDLGGAAIDLTGFAPSPPRGTFEIQLAD